MPLLRAYLSNVLNSSHFPLGHGELEFTWKPNCNPRIPPLPPVPFIRKKPQQKESYLNCFLGKITYPALSKRLSFVPHMG